MSGISRRINVLLLALTFVLVFSSSHSVLSAPPSPRENPELFDKLSGVVVIDPTWLVSRPLPSPLDLQNLFQLPTILGDVPVGPNVLTNQDQTTQAQNEPSIAVNPTDPNHIIATSNDYRLRVGPPPVNDVRAGYYVSFDGGLTWPGDGIIDISTIPNTFAAGDPAIAIHDINNVYYSYIAFNRSTDDGGVAVSKSTDGGLTWLDPVVVAWNSAAVFHDKEYLTVDATGSPYDGNVYLTWTRFSAGTPIVFSRSTNGGASFTAAVPISDASFSSNQGSVPAVGPNGVLYVAWLNYDTGSVRMTKSTNGGQSFTTPFSVASVNEIPSPLPGGEFRDNSFPTMTVDPTNGYVYVAWSDYRNNDADIYFTRSTNGGTSWSTPIRINDDTLYNDAHQFFPWMDVSPDGKLYVGWFDSRLDPTPFTAPLLYDEYVTASTDGGLTFSPNQRISEVTADSSIGGFSSPFIGDYSGLAATNDFVFPAWVDTRRNQEDIYTQRMNTIQGQKSAPQWVNNLQPFEYSINLNSTTNIPGNFINDPLPAEVTYVPGSAWASSGEIGFSDGTVNWAGDITSSTPITITFDVTPTAFACSPITNTALLTTGQGLDISLSASSAITGSVPAPEFTWTSSQLDFTFTNQTTGDAPLDFTWDFGDGITSTEVSPQHTYALAGEYPVKLTANNLCGPAEVTHLIDATCDAPSAAFTWQADRLLVSFTNQSSGVGPFEFSWDFGDGSTSTEESPAHSYSSPGRYLVRLVVTSPCGITEYETQILAGVFIFLPLTTR